MNLNNPAMKLYLTTVPISVIGGPRNGHFGTGFFIDFRDADRKTSRWLITNRHIVEHASDLKFRLHAGIKDSNNAVTMSQESFDLVMQNPSIETVFHPNDDLCGIPASSVFKGAESFGKILATETLREDMIPTDADLEKTATFETVLTVGYPVGFNDSANNLPVFRQGITASHPGIRFNGECRGVLDIASFGGSSGSPVLIWREGRSPILLGVVVDAHYYQEEGPIFINGATTAPPAVAKVNLPAHIGKYIRAEALLILKNEIIAQGKFL